MQFATAQGRDTLSSYQQFAEYVLFHLHDVLQKTIILSVQDTEDKLQIENAFLREAQSRGYNVYLRTEHLSMVTDTAVELQVVLNKGTSEIPTLDEQYRLCSMDVQWKNLYSGRAGVVSAVLILQDGALKETSEHQRKSWFEKVFVPLIVLGSSILIVYLFYTVRS